MSNMPHPAVFISSTQRDLVEYRMVVRDTILSFDLFPIMMEYFPAMDADAVQVCMDKVGESNLYLGIFAHRYGFCPEGRNISITELEFDHATKNSIPRLCFLIDEDAPWPHEHFEGEPGMAKLKQFKAKIEAKLIRAKFSTPESLRVEVVKALHNHFDHRDTILSIGGHNVTNVTIPIANDSSTSDSSRVKVQIILTGQDVLNFDSTTFKNALSGMLGISPNEITIFRVTIGSLLVYIELPMDAGVQLYKLAFGESVDHVLIQDGQLLSVSDLPIFSQPAILGDKQSFRLAQNPLGNRSENLEQAIAAYQQALTDTTKSKSPADWATTMMNMGNAYAEHIQGDKAENIEAAIDTYTQALSKLPKAGNERLWAALQSALGTALKRKYQGNRVENIEKAIDAYNQALTVQTQRAMPVEWAQTMMNMGDAYRNRIKGNKAENIEVAIQVLGKARPVMEQNAMSVDWAATMNNLGNACSERIRGDKAKNIEAAIAAYNQALIVRKKDTMPVDWAQTMMNLGNAYAVRIKGDKAENIEQAIAAYNQALIVRKKDTMPVAWAITMMNLGNAYRNRIKGNKAENIEVAIQVLDKARPVMEQNAMSVDWAIITNNLGNAYAVRIKGDKAENIEQAIAAYNQALIVRKKDTMPVEHRDTLKNLAQLYIGEKRWSEAHQTCLDAIEVGEDIFAVAVGDAGRMDTIGVMGKLYIWGAYSALQSGNYDAALEQLEASKVQLLAEAQSLGDAKLTEEERGQLQARRERIRNLEYEYRLPTGNLAHHNVRAISQELGDTRAELRELVDQFSKKYPDFKPKDLSLVDLLELIPMDGALVALLFTSHGSAVFVVPHGVCNVTDEHVIMLDDFTLDDLNAITRGVEDSPGWLHYYVDYRFRSAGMQRLFDGIENVTQRLWDAFVGTIHRQLQALGVQHVLLMPQGDTNLLPLHAAWRDIDGVRRYFMDDYAITYTSSMAALANAQRKTDKGIGALVAGVSDYGGERDLPNSRAEAENIAALFGVDPLLDERVSVEAVRSGSAGKAYVHLSCHGSFGWSSDAFASALYLGNDEVLPLPEIIAHLDLHQTRLVVLSACETGIVDVRAAPDEFVGLPAGFMQAGASAVVSSLWTVDDHSTALLMERFYHNLLSDRMEPADALRAAQFWLRDASVDEISRVLGSTIRAAGETFEQIFDSASSVCPYSSPYYWAAFTINGI